MPRRATPLTAARVRTAAPGRYADGDGLYLLVRDNGTAFWLFRYVIDGKMREAGLGRARGPNSVLLADARAAASPLYRLVRNGVDPLVQREIEKAAAAAAAQAEKARSITFRTVAGFYLEAHDAGWRNTKHAGQWRATLETYAYPHMGDLPVGTVGTAEVLAALEPIWREKPETANRVRGRIEAILDYAKTRQWRTGENPAAWRGHLDNLLPARSRVAKVKHHTALPWKEIADFMETLRGQDGVAAQALQFAILTAARTNEVLGAKWSEIDTKKAVWTVPEDRMKAGREHRVPLPAPALAVLEMMVGLRTDTDPASFVFPGMRAKRSRSNMAMLVLLRRMKRDDLTTHGFRGTFRDWAAETGKPNDIADAALAHTLGDKTQAAYQCGDLLERRRDLMTAWASHCEKLAAGVVPLRKAG